ncbi:MAG TPA: rhomboid family intramembrane serine protease [Chitinophagales bacterium]|nr:rhomboid family intramembrane serine protease [Chitinophagales bacterium]
MYEYRPTRYNVLPPVVKNLMILNGLMFLLTYIFPDEMFRRFGLFYVKSDFFHPYQFVTHMFMHGNEFHILFNMFALWMFGSALENLWGPKRFLFFYFFCGLGAAALHSTVSYFEITNLEQAGISAQKLMEMKNIPTVGASGAIYGLLMAFGMTFPNAHLMFILFPVPIKAKYFVVLLVVVELYLGKMNLFRGEGGIAHFAHLGGMLFGYILLRYWKKDRRHFY